MTHDTAPHAATFTEEEYAILCTVAGAMRMTADDFLASELRTSSPEEARGYLRAFVAHASDVQIRAIYFLPRALTERA